jgi:hypothetical protein
MTPRHSRRSRLLGVLLATSLGLGLILANTADGTRPSTDSTSTSHPLSCQWEGCEV